MNKNKIRFLLQAAEENICVLIKKFLAKKTFNLMDLCYWWNPSKEWWSNKKNAEIALKVLIEEGCCIRVAGEGKAAYKKTQPFVNLLEQTLRIEFLLEGTKNENP